MLYELFKLIDDNEMHEFTLLNYNGDLKIGDEVELDGAAFKITNRVLGMGINEITFTRQH